MYTGGGGGPRAGHAGHWSLVTLCPALADVQCPGSGSRRPVRSGPGVRRMARAAETEGGLPWPVVSRTRPEPHQSEKSDAGAHSASHILGPSASHRILDIPGLESESEDFLSVTS